MLADGVAGLTALFDPHLVADPYPTYAWLRAARPIWRPVERVYVLSRHEDCAAVLRDPRFGRAEEGRLGLRRVGQGGQDSQATAERPPVRSFLALNPPDHTRLRRLVSRAFTPARVRDLGPQIEAIAAELIETASASGGPVDLIAALASPLPVTVISELLGVPAADYDRLVSWSDALARGLDPAFLISAEDRERQQAARAEFGAYLSDLIAERRRFPGHDLVSALVGVIDDGDVLSSSVQPTGTPACAPTRSNSTSRGRHPTMCPSGRASTSAWARRSPAWRPRSSSACSCSDRMISAWPATRPGRRTPSCGASAASQSPSAGETHPT
jgi:cytochrome P450